MPDYGLLGGIGAGLSSFTDAFRSERAYQEQKNIRAQDQALKKRAANISAVEALAKFKESSPYGYTDDEVNPLKDSMGLRAPPAAVAPDLEAPQGQPPQASGMLSPQQGMIAQQSSGDSTGFHPGRVQLQHNYELAKEGKTVNPSTGVIDYDPASSIGRAGMLEQGIKGADLKNKNMEQYDKFKTAWNSNEVKQNTDFADEAYGKVVNSYKNPSKFGDKALVLNMVKLDMGKQAAREGTLEHMQQNPQIMSKWGNFINQAVSGTLEPATRDDLVKTATTLRQSARQALEDQRQAAVKEAQVNGVKPDFANDTAYRRMDKVASQFEQQIPGNPSAPKPGGLMAKIGGILPGVKSQATPPSAHPQDVEAVQWAKQNPKDPRSKQILKMNGL